MSKLSKRLKELRNSKGLSQQALANEIGISKSSINMYERGEREPSVDTLELFADYYNVDMNYLLGNSSIPNTSLHLSEQINYPNIFPIKKHRIRLLGDIACGKPIYADEEREVYVDVGTDIKADFCLRAKGDSMINARIMDGDIVFIREQPMVNNGEIAAVIIDDEATLKFFVETGMGLGYQASEEFNVNAYKARYPKLAEQVPYHDIFRDFDHSTGSNLPDSPCMVAKAQYLLDISSKY